MAANAAFVDLPTVLENAIADKLYGQYLDNFLISEFYGLEADKTLIPELSCLLIIIS